MRYFPGAITSKCPGESVEGKKLRLEGDFDCSFSTQLAHRRAITAMGYLFVISLILCVAIAGIGYFGKSTTHSMHKSSRAIHNATSTK